MCTGCILRRIKRKEENLLREVRDTKRTNFLKFKIETLVKLQLHYEIAVISSILIFIGIMNVHENLVNLFGQEIFVFIFWLVFWLVILFVIILIIKIWLTVNSVWKFYEKYLDSLT